MNFVKIFLGEKGKESKNCCSIEIKEVDNDSEESCCHSEETQCC
ncbi:hypothetical protein [Bacillus sp. Marseille-Q1617]|nr:hypothetical protein [Bacillus sp. Marseille-Q1617]